MRYLFFSCESQAPAGYFFTKFMCPVEELFNSRYSKDRHTEMLDNISMIPILLTEEALLRMEYKERKYVTKKRRYADMRLKMDFLEFVQGDDEHKVQMSMDMMRKAIEYVASKVSDFKKELFIEDLLSVIKEVYPQMNIV